MKVNVEWFPLDNITNFDEPEQKKNTERQASKLLSDNIQKERYKKYSDYIKENFFFFLVYKKGLIQDKIGKELNTARCIAYNSFEKEIKDKQHSQKKRKTDRPAILGQHYLEQEYKDFTLATLD